MLQVLQPELSRRLRAMAELSPHRMERQALLAKDAPTPSMAKYAARVGRARQANQNARNQALPSLTLREQHRHQAISPGC